MRYTLRGLRRSPGFTVAVVVTLGLGIGANAAMFNVIDQLMFRDYPYLRDPAQRRSRLSANAGPRAAFSRASRFPTRAIST